MELLVTQEGSVHIVSASAKWLYDALQRRDDNMRAPDWERAELANWDRAKCVICEASGGALCWIWGQYHQYDEPDTAYSIDSDPLIMLASDIELVAEICRSRRDPEQLRDPLQIEVC